VKPLFADADASPSLALFAYGQLLQGQPLAWVLPPAGMVSAKLQGRLWRMPSGAVLLSVEPRGAWVLGELHPHPAAASLRALPGLLAAPDVQPSFQQVRVRVGTRAQLVQVWAVPEAQLIRVGAHPLASGDWRRFAPR